MSIKRTINLFILRVRDHNPTNFTPPLRAARKGACGADRFADVKEEPRAVSARRGALTAMFTVTSRRCRR